MLKSDLDFTTAQATTAQTVGKGSRQREREADPAMPKDQEIHKAANLGDEFSIVIVLACFLEFFLYLFFPGWDRYKKTCCGWLFKNETRMNAQHAKTQQTMLIHTKGRTMR